MTRCELKKAPKWCFYFVIIVAFLKYTFVLCAQSIIIHQSVLLVHAVIKCQTRFDDIVNGVQFTVHVASVELLKLIINSTSHV